VPAAEDQQVIETLAPGCPHEPFGKMSSLGGSERAGGYSLPDLVEGGAELGVAITEQEPGTQLSVLQLPGQVPRLLDDPGPARPVGAAGEVDATAADLDPEQHVELGQPDGIHTTKKSTARI
jgi:hypothetical protein